MSKPTHHATFRSLILIAASLVALSALAIGYTIWSLRDDAIRDASQDAQNIAIVLGEQMARSIQTVDIVISDMRERLRSRSLNSPDSFEGYLRSEAIHTFLIDRLARLPQADFIALIGKDGFSLNTTRQWPAPKADLSDRDYLRHFRNVDDDGLYVSRLLVNRVTGEKMIFFSSRLIDNNNHFHGVILIGLRLTYFEHIYNSISLLRNQTFTLLRSDGTVLLHYPVPTETISEKIPPSSSWYELARNGRNGTYRSNDGAGGARLVAAQKLHGYPLVINVSVSESSALSDWRRRASQIAVGTLLGVCCLIFLLRSLSAQYHRLLASENSLADRELSLAEKSSELERANIRIDAALHNMSQGLCMFDSDGHLVVCNERYVNMYNLSPDIVKPGCSLLTMLEHRKTTGTFVNDPHEYDKKIRASARNGEKLNVTMELADGRVVEVVNQPMADGGWVATHEEVTDRVRAERERDEAERFLHTVVDHLPSTVFVKDARTNRYVLINKAAEEMYGVSREQMIGKKSHEVFSPEQAEAIEARDRESLRSDSQMLVKELPFQGLNKQTRLLNVKRVAIPGGDGKPRFILGVAEDVTDRKRAEARIAHLAHHDPLTGLPNRTAFNECFAATLESAKVSGEPFALMCLDLDRFKHVNDLFGHSMGDALLCHVARRLEAAARGAFLARIGGDEFCLLVTENPLPEATARLAERIVTALGDNIDVQGRKLMAHACVGIAIYPNDARDGETLISNADAALYRAKADGVGSFRFFEQEMDHQLREARELQHDFKAALAANEFQILYQPEAEIDGTIIGFEALTRWQHPTRGLIPPAKFIPLAEDSGLITSFGEWVLRDACREAAQWKSGAQLAVNLSPAQFCHDLPNLVHSVLLETGLAPSRLELEITESVLIDDFGRAQSILRRLKALGVKIAMDDFGTGYSSLSYLQSFPFDKIKIDRSFVSDLCGNGNNAAIVRAVITLARSLSLPVLAEGVETEEQRAFLEREGCDQVQGYLFGKPLPIETYSAWTDAPPRPSRTSANSARLVKNTPAVEPAKRTRKISVG